MQKLWAITVNELRGIFLDRAIWINLVLIPIGLVYLIGIANGAFAGGGELQAIPIDVLAYDSGELSQALVSALQRNPRLIVCTPYSEVENCPLDVQSEAQAEARIERGTTAAYVLIPEGFSAQALDGQPANVIYRSEESASGSPTVQRLAVENALQQVSGALVAQRIGQQVASSLSSAVIGDQTLPVPLFTSAADQALFDQAVFDRAAEQWAAQPITLDYQVLAADEASTVSGFAQSVPGMGTMYVFFNVMAGMLALITERKQGTLQRLGMMPVQRRQVIGGKMLARFLLGLTQYVIVFGAGYLLGVRYSSVLGLLLLMVAFTLCVTALTFVLANVVQNEQQAASLALFLGLTLAPLGGAWWPLEIVPAWMQTLAYASPVGWVMRGFSAIMLYGQGIGAALLPSAVLIGAAGVLFWVAVRRFRFAG